MGTPKPNIFIRFLMLLRNLIGIAQVIVVLSGCGAFLVSNTEELTASIQLFLILLAAQLFVLLLLYLAGRSA